jgi:formimidoylglutamate deiminase
VSYAGVLGGADPETEHGWLPDLVYTGGTFHSGLAMFADATGRIARFSAAPADLAKAQRLAGRAMLPGLVNGHSHAFQRVLRGRTEHRSAHHRSREQRDSFWTWRESMYRAANLLSSEALYHVSRMAFLEMLLGGITTAGEFHYMHHAPGGSPHGDRNQLARQVLRAARDTGLRIAVLRTAYARSGWGQPADPGQARFLTPRVDDFIADTEALRSALAGGDQDRTWVGVAPHSLRAVPLAYLREAVNYARAHQMQVHMHVSEQPADVEACVAEHGVRPVELLEQNGLLDSRFTAVHAIHITGGEIAALAGANAVVCACPTTERNLGDGPVPASELMNAGVRVSLGSDSNVQIALLEDARSLEYHLRMVRLERAVLAAKHLFACATESGAASLAAPGGSLEIGRPADFFTVALDDPSLAGADAESLLSNIVFAVERTAVRDVAIGGQFVILDGRHPLGEEIVGEFTRVQRDLWN